VVLVGGGNSAGQAAVYLASQVAKVWMIVRGKSLAASMSRYLIERIESRPISRSSSAARSPTSSAREPPETRSPGAPSTAGAETRRPMRHLFLFIGAAPNTDWLEELPRRAGPQRLRAHRRRDPASRWRPACPGVFAIGDVRAGSVKRVAAAVGEGAQVVAAIHAYLAEA
jgi:thioredoxin reductase (NADPH)